jgi:hypothetical protein
MSNAKGGGHDRYDLACLDQADVLQLELEDVARYGLFCPEPFLFAF